jgi:hypothetical protein
MLTLVGENGQASSVSAEVGISSMSPQEYGAMQGGGVGYSTGGFIAIGIGRGMFEDEIHGNKTLLT